MDGGGGPVGVESRLDGERGAGSVAAAAAAAKSAEAAAAAAAVAAASAAGAGDWSTSWLGWFGAAVTLVYYWVLGLYARDVRTRPDLRPGLLAELTKRRR